MCIYILALISRNLKTPYFNNKQFADLVQKTRNLILFQEIYCKKNKNIV